MSTRQSTLVFALFALTTPTLLADPPVDYTRDIKPILTRRCYECHGPLKQRGGLRLDTAKLMRQGGDTGPALVPGKAKKSLLIKAIHRTGTLRMPPKGKALPAKDIALLERWINAGAQAPDEVAVANWREHWSFRPPTRPKLPKPAQAAWLRNPIDAFIAAHHDKHKLQATKPATKARLLRRVYLDLIGLPPTRHELRAFLNDTSPNAYETVVDRLLKSPRYGERWGRHWMDVWRYSDWYGRRNSNEIRYSQHHIWRWRDWIIESVNADKGYDRMITEMLAGDEIAPNDPKILRATGFLGRNWYKFDRDVWLRETVEHTSMGFLGLTMKCARCHDHKFDPIPQVDYYRFRAFFEPHDVRLDPITANTDPKKNGLARVYDARPKTPTYLFERGDDRYPDKENPLTPGVPKSLGNTRLTITDIKLPVESFYPALRPEVVQASLQKSQANIDTAKTTLAKTEQTLASIQRTLAHWNKPKPKQPTPVVQPRGTIIFADDFAKPNDKAWQMIHGNWQYNNGKLLQTQVTNWAMIATRTNHPTNFKLRVRYKTKPGGVYNSIGIAFDVTDQQRDFQAVYTSISRGRSSVQAFHRTGGKEVYPTVGIVRHPLQMNETITLDIAVRDRLLNVWVDGVLKIAYTMPMARRRGRFALWNHSGKAEFDDVHISTLPDNEQLVKSIRNGTTITAKPRTKADWQQRLHATQGELVIQRKQLAAAVAEHDALQARIAAERNKYAMVRDPKTKDLARAASRAERHAAVLRAEKQVLHWQHQLTQSRATKSNAKTLATTQKKLTAAKKTLQSALAKLKANSTSYTALGKMYPKTSTGRRRALAQWIANGKNPRTARVAINHIWKRHFGTALVPTVANFGLAGKQPSHPDLLDWLAVEFVDHKWSMKHIHRLIVTSNTYRMSSAPDSNSARNRTVDATNRYLWRMNYRRMEGEVVRDSLLHVAGQLDTTMGGPELPQKLGQTSRRRSVYFRHTPDDKMEFLQIFDLANPNECYQRQESVVPQQSLALMNSALAQTQARLVARVLTKELANTPTKTPEGDFVNAAFAQVLCRMPTTAERVRCVEFLRAQAKLLRNKKTLTPFGGSVTLHVPPSADAVVRSRENLVHVLFNHNDFVTIR